jgi:hypothetical protein
MHIAFCPSCGADLCISEYETFTRNIVWNPCGSRHCYYRKVSIKTDANGFVMEPAQARGRYLYTRNRELSSER